jgi:hypothetical protein
MIVIAHLVDLLRLYFICTFDGFIDIVIVIYFIWTFGGFIVIVL